MHTFGLSNCLDSISYILMSLARLLPWFLVSSGSLIIANINFNITTNNLHVICDYIIQKQQTWQNDTCSKFSMKINWIFSFYIIQTEFTTREKIRWRGTWM